MQLDEARSDDTPARCRRDTPRVWRYPAWLVLLILDRCLLTTCLRRVAPGSYVVTGIAIGIVLQIVLVIVFGGIERSGRDDLGDDLAWPTPRRVHEVLQLLRGHPLRL